MLRRRQGIRFGNMELAGVKVDEDFKRYYPYNELASKVLGFTGGDNQGIIGLEVKYEEYLKGTDGKILTRHRCQRSGTGRDAGEARIEPVAGNDSAYSVWTTIFRCMRNRWQKKSWKKSRRIRSAILLMNPQNGEILCHGQCTGI